MKHITTKLVLIMLVIIGTMNCVTGEVTIDELTAFLAEDQTDTHEHLQWYSCGHFARDLARNASEHNISIGSVILSNHPVFGGKWNSHIVNYVMINDTIAIIDPQTDSLFGMNLGMTFDGKQFEYYRLYPDGTQVPSNWDCNLAHTGKVSEYGLLETTG